MLAIRHHAGQQLWSHPHVGACAITDLPQLGSPHCQPQHHCKHLANVVEASQSDLPDESLACMSTSVTPAWHPAINLYLYQPAKAAAVAQSGTLAQLQIGY